MYLLSGELGIVSENACMCVLNIVFSLFMEVGSGLHEVVGSWLSFMLLPHSAFAKEVCMNSYVEK